MHELALMQDMVEAVEEKMRGRPEKVKRVVLDVGKVAGVMPEALRFCFEACAKGSVAEDALLEIREKPGIALCAACRAELELSHPYGVCACGSADLRWVSGREIRIHALEVA